MYRLRYHARTAKLGARTAAQELEPGPLIGCGVSRASAEKTKLHEKFT